MLKRIDSREALVELLNQNENIYIKGKDAYLKALDRTFSFNEFGAGWYFNETQFFVEIEDNEEI